ncbi:type II secretion system minor pseudopilin GspK [Aestuariicoccus sp. MJ-SS9]|uniref:type II secretion system minor pseudopilin GspK n=1 Tax=Aestuariicoccus sp. MJ-SS9 TaxID=3079855 RepID=UPI00290DBB86|nr:type II secretion system minor pseudopilin GspK [Aestuariicoccus sp. MJ-SS9]MDU8912179.1 type II secretion system minor pseudopilin GspK [Aestuariicoccus sp. MJ-SS9]
MSGERGFVLVNALVLVAALSAAALLLLSRSAATRDLAGAATQASQLSANLDAFEALALTLLEADRPAGPVDHRGEAWARADYDVPLDRGRVAGGLRDMQGLFNLNWLANPDDIAAQEAFARLTASLGIAPHRAEAIAAHLAPDGPAQRAGYASAAVPTDPLGGALYLAAQLREVPGLSAGDLERLAAVTTVLPGDVRLNVNTAPAAVLAAFLPSANTAALGALVAGLSRDPLTSVDAFAEALGGLMDDEALAALDMDRFAVGSDWFEMRAEARLEGRRAARLAVLRRLPLPQGSGVAYRLDDWN